MKVLYIGSFGKLWDEEGTAKGLEANGCTVVRMGEPGFDLNEYMSVLRKERPDFVMFAKLKVRGDIRKNVLAIAKDVNAKTVCLVPDLYFGLSREYKLWVDPIFKADLVLTPDGGQRDWKTIIHRVYRQAIPDEYCYIGEPNPDKYDYDVAFVGCRNPEYPYRDELIRNLRTWYGPKFKWFGRMDSDEVRGHELNRLYSTAKVIVGDSVYAPKYWSNRIYETLGRCAALVHPLTEGIEEAYEPYVHFTPYTYGDWDGLHNAIDALLDAPRTRQDMALSAFNRTKAKHVQSVRCKELVALLKSL